MPNWARSILKWTAAVVALLLVVSYTVPRIVSELRSAVELEQGEDEDLLPEEESEEPRAIQRGEEPAVLDLSERNGTVQQVATEHITVGEAGGEQLFAGFHHIPADTACLLEVLLDVAVLEVTAGELYARPAQLRDPLGLTDGAPLPPDVIIEGVEPAIAVSDGNAGVLVWDVTDVYTLASREAPADVVMLSVSPQLEDETGYHLLVAATEGGEENAPRLRWRAVEGCEGEEDGTGAPGGAEPTEEPAPEEQTEQPLEG